MDELTQSVIFSVLSVAALTGLAAVATWLMCRVRIMDIPNHRSSHVRPVANSGGVAIVLSAVVGAAVYLTGGVGGPLSNGQLVAVATAISAIIVVGLLDDLGRLENFRTKFATQIAASGILLMSGIVIENLTLPFLGGMSLGWLGYPLTLVWVVGLTNAFNFMDGLNGLAAGTAVVCLTFFGLIGYQGGLPGSVAASCILLSACLGFLPFNFPKARIFMGDVGSQFLGFSLATIAVVAAGGGGARISMLVMPILLFHFIFDTAFTFCRRLLSGENVTQAHRAHLYQLLNRLGWSHARVTGILCLFAIVQGGGAILIERSEPSERSLIVLFILLIQTVYAVAVVRAARRRGLI